MKKLLIILIIALRAIPGPDQVLDTLDARMISIAGIWRTTPPDSVKSKLGTPVDYSVYEEEEGETEEYDQWFYFTYDSLKLAFYQHKGERYGSSFATIGRSYPIILGDIRISVGASLSTLEEHFPHSFQEFTSRRKIDKNEEELYIRIAEIQADTVSYDGIVTIKIVENRIAEV